ncbi:MAG: hypothetical protein ABFS46_15355 [Myxococcota bacterium]
MYPPGHYPYGQVALVRVAPDGSRVGDATATDTLFEAALDAAEGRSWERSVPGWKDADPDPALEVPGWRSTQQRRLKVAVRNLGLDSGIATQHRIAMALYVDTLVLRDAASRIRACPGDRARGQAVQAVLEARPAEHRLVRLLIAGHLAGLWGRPWWWRRGVLRPLGPFRSSGTPPGCPQIRSAKGSTKGGRGPPGAPG